MQEEIHKNSPSLNKECKYLKTSRIVKLPYYLTIQFVRFLWKKDKQVKAKIVRVCNENCYFLQLSPLNFPFGWTFTTFVVMNLKHSWFLKGKFFKSMKKKNFKKNQRSKRNLNKTKRKKTNQRKMQDCNSIGMIYPLNQVDNLVFAS